jgi:hypothetical protein
MEHPRSDLEFALASPQQTHNDARIDEPVVVLQSTALASASRLSRAAEDDTGVSNGPGCGIFEQGQHLRTSCCRRKSIRPGLFTIVSRVHQATITSHGNEADFEPVRHSA